MSIKHILMRLHLFILAPFMLISIPNGLVLQRPIVKILEGKSFKSFGMSFDIQVHGDPQVDGNCFKIFELRPIYDVSFCLNNQSLIVRFESGKRVFQTPLDSKEKVYITVNHVSSLTNNVSIYVAGKHHTYILPDFSEIVNKQLTIFADTTNHADFIISGFSFLMG